MAPASAIADPGTNRAGVPWYLWSSALAVTSAYVGGYWDISWHRPIGRDTFWSAPHTPDRTPRVARLTTLLRDTIARVARRSTSRTPPRRP